MLLSASFDTLFDPFINKNESFSIYFFVIGVFLDLSLKAGFTHTIGLQWENMVSPGALCLH